MSGSLGVLGSFHGCSKRLSGLRHAPRSVSGISWDRLSSLLGGSEGFLKTVLVLCMSCYLGLSVGCVLMDC